jgi:hypothetical protein
VSAASSTDDGELVTPRLDVVLEQLHLKVGLLFQILEQA